MPLSEVMLDAIEKLKLTVIPNKLFEHLEIIRRVNQVSWLNACYGSGA